MKNGNKYSIALAMLFMLIGQSNIAQKVGTEPIPLEGIPTIISFFEEKPLVALGETHEHVQLYEFLTDLVQTKNFYTQVNDILIESGSALYQETLDKYIAGKKVKMEDLQLVWMNTTQSPVDPWSSIVYSNFLKTIRELNQRIPKKHRIRVIAADPAIQWEKVHNQEDYLAARGSRDAFYSQTAIDEVLKKNRKALMINGGAHYGNHDPKKRKVNQRIEAIYPNTVTVVLASSGIGKGYEAREKALKWQPGTITKVHGTWIGERPGPQRVMMTPPSPAPSGTTSSAASTAPISRAGAPPSKYKHQDYYEYLLYLGTLEDLRHGEIDPTKYRSDDLWKEMNRRSMARFNHPLIPETRKTGSLRPKAYN